MKRGKFQSYKNYCAKRTAENNRIKALLKGRLVHLSAGLVPKRDEKGMVIMPVEFMKVVIGGTFRNPIRNAERKAFRARRYA